MRNIMGPPCFALAGLRPCNAVHRRQGPSLRKRRDLLSAAYPVVPFHAGSRLDRFLQRTGTRNLLGSTRQTERLRRYFCSITSFGNSGEHRVRKAAVLIIGGLALSLICTAQSGKIETLGPLTETSVPDAVRQTLDSKGYRVLLDESTPACELWLRKNVPVQPEKDTQDVIYTQLADSTFVGI